MKLTEKEEYLPEQDGPTYTIKQSNANKELLHEYTAISMQLQEEYLKKPQNFEKQEKLNDRLNLLGKEILARMQ